MIKKLTDKSIHGIIQDRNIFIKVGDIMVVLLNEAKKQLKQLVSRVQKDKPIMIVDKDTGNNAVLISESEWNSIQETLYLLEIPGMADSLLKGSKEPISECTMYIKGETW